MILTMEIHQSLGSYEPKQRRLIEVWVYMNLDGKRWWFSKEKRELLSLKEIWTEVGERGRRGEIRETKVFLGFYKA